MRFREVLTEQFTTRQRRNHRYSLRRFARELRVHHSTLSRLLNGQRPIQADAIARLGVRLGVASDQLRAFITREEIELVRGAIGRPAFRPDSRWLASVSGLSVDRVNIALHTLLRSRQLRMEAADRWSLVGHRGVE